MAIAHVLTMAHHISLWKGFEATTSRGLCTPSGCLVPPRDGMGPDFTPWGRLGNTDFLQPSQGGTIFSDKPVYIYNYIYTHNTFESLPSRGFPLEPKNHGGGHVFKMMTKKVGC